MNDISTSSLNSFFDNQLCKWDEVADRYEQVKQAITKVISIDGFDVTVQYNPSRITSSAAKTDAASISSRPCFLCDNNRPRQQHHLDWEDLRILVNPFPICSRHFTAPSQKHIPQLIDGVIAQMVRLAETAEGMTVFYNGPKCGASAPDHFHFQIVGSSELPLTKAIAEGRAVPFGYYRITGDYENRFRQLTQNLPVYHGETEPKFNLLCFSDSGKVNLIVIPRRNHRPDFYGSDKGQMLVSPASIDLGGIMVAPRQEDFDNFNETTLRELYRQLCFSQAELDRMQQPRLSVGLLESDHITVRFINGFEIEGEHTFRVNDVATNNGGRILIKSITADSLFEVDNIVIGKQFHWQRNECQRFNGDVEIIADNCKLHLVNHVNVEDYLKSVISSEMSATASLSLLKAHAVISRSWVLAQIGRKLQEQHEAILQQVNEGDEIIRWYDREDHNLFDVCADDHCQRYQGTTRQTTPLVAEAVNSTCGEVLMYGDELCDARFSKCCGGVTEVFESCWENRPKPYLKAIRDSDKDSEIPDLRCDMTASEWIMRRPDAFCNTDNPDILSQVLNSYDRETLDFYRWKISYTTAEISALIARKSGLDLGEIINIEPIERGPSGRITRLRITGAKQSVTVGKELEIRKWLSPTHLYSSAFTVTKTVTGFVLHGAGWGHGVGLCQIGAAVMGHLGYDYRQILAHYYPGAVISRRY